MWKKLFKNFLPFLLVLFTLTFFCPTASFAITYFNSASSPADDSTNTSQTTSVTPPASMQDGDLVLLFALNRQGSQTLSISATGGQSWTALNGFDDGTIQGRAFWCRFNGTWGADPSVTSTASPTSSQVVMHVFRPTTSTNTWAVDNTWSSASYSAPSSPFTVSRTGVTTTQASTVTIAMFASRDNNTWTNQTGASWIVTGNNQYRNSSSTGTSLSFAHAIQIVAGATGTVTKDQGTLGGDAGFTGRVSFAESAASDTPTPTPTPTSTNTPTVTPTFTPTHTPTITPTFTPTETPTNTPAVTPTFTNTPTNTPTSTPTNTPGNTPTNTPTSTPTNTPVPSANCVLGILGAGQC